MKRWLVTISGFTQHIGQPIGMTRLWRRLRRLSSPTTCVTFPLPWDSPWERVAAFIRSESDGGAEVQVYAYSWGAGHGFIRLAEALGEGRKPLLVSAAVLADPVYRSPWLPAWLPFNPLSLTRAPKIKIPWNVLEVAWLRQRTDRPCGHDLITDTPLRTRILDCVELSCGHQDMDDRDEFHELALRYAEAA